MEPDIWMLHAAVSTRRQTQHLCHNSGAHGTLTAMHLPALKGRQAPHACDEHKPVMSTSMQTTGYVHATNTRIVTLCVKCPHVCVLVHFHSSSRMVMMVTLNVLTFISLMAYTTELVDTTSMTTSPIPPAHPMPLILTCSPCNNRSRPAGSIPICNMRSACGRRSCRSWDWCGFEDCV